MARRVIWSPNAPLLSLFCKRRKGRSFCQTGPTRQWHPTVDRIGPGFSLEWAEPNTSASHRQNGPTIASRNPASFAGCRHRLPQSGFVSLPRPYFLLPPFPNSRSGEFIVLALIPNRSASSSS
jgi:hypothetical protein